MEITNLVKKANDHIALKVTLAVGTIWCVYAFALLVMIPVFFPATQMVIMYISSSFLQLVLLPLIMVGQNLLGKKADERAQEDHERLIQEFQELKAMHEEAKDERRDIIDMHKDLHKYLKSDIVSV